MLSESGSGFNFQRTIEFRERPFHVLISWLDALDLIKQFHTGMNAIQQFANHVQVTRMEYMDLFLRTRCAVRHHLILDDNCYVTPLNKEFAPRSVYCVRFFLFEVLEL